MTIERNELPGRPSARLLREVRAVLWRRLRARPERADARWRAAWQWAAACCDRTEFMAFGFYKKKRSRPWPLPNEIASTYLLLVLAEMKSDHALRLPWRAAECMPEGIATRFGLLNGPQLPRITGPEEDDA